MTPSRETGIVSIPSNHTVDQTVEKLEAILQTKGVKLFALIDHSGEAEKAGMQMRPTKLLIFGNPKAGTPLMVASPGVAIDLPLKILVAEDSNGKVHVSWNSPTYLQARHNLPAQLVQNIAVVETLAAKAGPSDGVRRVDRGCCAIYPRIVEVNFTPRQEAQLLQIADHTGTDAEQLVKDAALRLVEEHRRFRAGVRRGIAQAEKGELLEHADVKARIERLLQS